MPVTVAALQVMPLHVFRELLRVLLVGALLLLPLAARQRRLQPVLACVTVAGLVFWGLPYFGQGLSHAPGDILVLLGLAVLVHRPDHLLRPSRMVPLLAAFGGGVVYLEFLTGQLPTACALLLPIVYLASSQEAAERVGRADAWGRAGLGMLAFTFGAVSTVFVKQVLATLFVSTGSVDSFTGNFALYTGITDRLLGPMERLVHPLLDLLRAGRVLTYGSWTGVRLLYSATALAWLAAAVLAVRSRDAGAQSDLLAFVAGAATVLAWIFVFPVHTSHHSWMSRLLLAPMALGWGALVWQITRASRQATTDAHSR